VVPNDEDEPEGGYICGISLREGTHVVAGGLRECVIVCGIVAYELTETPTTRNRQ
jgi:hypothetical protein